jgi:sugar porter (SP) family MFS transporter
MGALTHDIDLDDAEQQLATALTILGAAIGSLFSSVPSDRWGKKRVLVINNINFYIGGILTTFVDNVGVFFFGRFILGLGIGLGSMIVPVLLAEIAPPSMRGTIASLHQLFVTIGILVCGLVSYGFVTYVEHGWKYVQFGHVLPAVPQVILSFYIPESPRWLIRQPDGAGRARDTLRDVRPDGDVQEELQQMVSEMESSEQNEVTWAEVFALKKPLVIGFGLMFFQSMTGINSVMFYSTKIFAFAGFSEAILATVSVGCVNVLMTIVCVYLVDRAGRRSLLIGGTSAMVGALLLLGIVLLSMNDYPDAQGILAVLALLLFVCGFAIGLGAVAWVVMGEVVPTRVRSKANSLFVAENWGWNLILASTVLYAINGLGGGDSDDDKKKGVAILYFIFCGVALLGVFFCFTFPETKGKSLEELQAMLTGNSLQNGHIQTIPSGGADKRPLLHTRDSEED